MKRHLHLILAVVWVLIAVPGVTIWADSIRFVIFVSLYTVVADHVIGWHAQRAQEAAEGGDG